MKSAVLLHIFHLNVGCRVFLFYTLETKMLKLRKSQTFHLKTHIFFYLSVAMGFDGKTVFREHGVEEHIYYTSFPTLLLTFQPLRRKWHIIEKKTTYKSMRSSMTFEKMLVPSILIKITYI